MAHHCGLEAERFVYYLGNAHIYDDHLVALEKQLDNQPYNFPQINIKNIHYNIGDYTVDDFEITDYTSHEKIAMEMRK